MYRDPGGSGGHAHASESAHIRKAVVSGVSQQRDFVEICTEGGHERAFSQWKLKREKCSAAILASLIRQSGEVATATDETLIEHGFAKSAVSNFDRFLSPSFTRF
jgi:hypothetical protein